MGDTAAEARLPWDDAALYPKEPVRVRRYRRLQSWYRETQLDEAYAVLPGRPATATRPAREAQAVGSLLQPALEPLADTRNFLAPSEFATEILDYVNARVPQVRRAKGTLEEGRLRLNMLSSMPMCFNIFAPLRNRPAATCALLQDLFGLDAQRLVDIHGIGGIECEWAPPRAHGALDGSAFDAVIAYADSYERVGLLGIETKYTDSFSPKQYAQPGIADEADRRRTYIAAMRQSGWFKDGSADVLWQSATNQMWRNTMLAGVCESLPGVATAHVATVRLYDDPGADRAVSAVRQQLIDGSKLIDVPLERLLRNPPPDLVDWAHALQRRYTDLSPVEKATEQNRATLQNRLDEWFPRGCWVQAEAWRSTPYEFGCPRPLAKLRADHVLVVHLWREDHWSGDYPLSPRRIIRRNRERCEIEIDAGRWRLSSEVPELYAAALATQREQLLA
ncbi:MAG: hypothetical protein U0W40_15515 [Acidimicrobiia bacterium]